MYSWSLIIFISIFSPVFGLASRLDNSISNHKGVFLKKRALNRNDADVCKHTEPTDEWKNAVLEQHNVNRAHYGAMPLTWSDELYPGTEKWACSCVYEHSNPLAPYGECLAAGDPASYGIEDAVADWMKESKDYDYQHPGFSMSTGHFTQVVWKSTKQVACALVTCEKGTFPDVFNYVICRYMPSGNYDGEFEKNVGKPQRPQYQ
uniref:PR-1 protein n=1 Tax=Moniliophthora perniciosa TaxID=153609 RepID=H6U750_MONPR|nr:PR-1 protein [Moniliophthora perniciosa]QVT77423.1 pathogenesis-related protein 1 [Moniliophthora perniciosa]QVT77424.1 pathogenesis-related protein 1 [Moniliophthora perniciosa]QVT77425.1 pathogenesis-related protein 1 [Moniliophthora perniciosa]QVT77427.1 pathogenesis-related protein 1 [Moniliophthora perniciosa]